MSLLPVHKWNSSGIQISRRYRPAHFGIRIRKSTCPLAVIKIRPQPAKEIFISICLLVDQERRKTLLLSREQGRPVDMAFPGRTCGKHTAEEFIRPIIGSHIKTGNFSPEHRMIPLLPLHRIAKNLYPKNILSCFQIRSQIHPVIEPYFSVAFGRSDLDQKSIDI